MPQAAIRPTILVITLGLMFAIPAPAAQATFPPKSFQNLQVLPKDASASLVVGTMKGFANNLGVRCQFCHIGQEGLPLEQFDFVSDEMATKKAARAMMRLTQDINRQLDVALPQPPGAAPRVTCITCHRGKAKPSNLREP